VKAAVVTKRLHECSNIEERLIHTGQHHDSMMSGVFFDELGLQPPRANLGIAGGTHGAQTGRMLEALERVFLEDRPDWVLVYGDTNSTLAGALAAAKLSIPVAHVEAGLRSFNRAMPEEINRIVTDDVAELLFAPTEVAERHLLKEGKEPRQIERVGDVMYDATVAFSAKAERQSSVLQRLGLAGVPYVLATIHRQENADHPDRLRRIVEALCDINRDVQVVLPLHPRTRHALAAYPDLSRLAGSLRLIEPVGYFDMLMLERHSQLIVTDSGGVQKEAFFHGVPCVTLRTETEWTELIDAGWNVLAPPLGEVDIPGTLRAELERKRSPDARPPLYGTGDASRLIARRLSELA
jgi:UDP-GlcNAc3NAcA epimerase